MIAGIEEFVAYVLVNLMRFLICYQVYLKRLYPAIELWKFHHKTEIIFNEVSNFPLVVDHQGMEKNDNRQQM